MTALHDPDPVRRAQARAVARRLHPDLGGDPAAYLAAMAELDRGGRPAPRTAVPPSTPTGEQGRSARARRALRRRARGTARAFWARVPRGLPGARRWAGL